MKVQDLKKDDRFYHRFYRDDILIRVYWIARIFHNSYLIDYGTGLIELNGNKTINMN